MKYRISIALFMGVLAAGSLMGIRAQAQVQEASPSPLVAQVIENLKYTIEVNPTTAPRTLKLIDAYAIVLEGVSPGIRSSFTTKLLVGISDRDGLIRGALLPMIDTVDKSIAFGVPEVARMVNPIIVGLNPRIGDIFNKELDLPISAEIDFAGDRQGVKDFVASRLDSALRSPDGRGNRFAEKREMLNQYTSHFMKQADATGHLPEKVQIPADKLDRAEAMAARMHAPLSSRSYGECQSGCSSALRNDVIVTLGSVCAVAESALEAVGAFAGISLGVGGIGSAWDHYDACSDNCDKEAREDEKRRKDELEGPVSIWNK